MTTIIDNQKSHGPGILLVNTPSLMDDAPLLARTTMIARDVRTALLREGAPPDLAGECGLAAMLSLRSR
jgi:hypothetical protein